MRPIAAIGVVTVIFGGSAASGSNPDMAVRIASVWPWCRIDSSSAISAKNQKVFSGRGGTSRPRCQVTLRQQLAHLSDDDLRAMAALARHVMGEEAAVAPA